MRIPMVLAAVMLAAYGCSSSSDDGANDESGASAAVGTLVTYEVPGIR